MARLSSEGETVTDVARRFRLDGRVAIVTGGTRGIGLAAARALLDQGASVAVASRKAEACAEAERRLESHGPAIVNVASSAAFVASSAAPMYAASKAALVSLTRSMAATWAPVGIRVNALVPGGVDTDMVRRHPPEAAEGLRRSCLLQRIATPDEMAAPVVFLASSASSFMTGQVLVVDGGALGAS